MFNPSAFAALTIWLLGSCKIDDPVAPVNKVTKVADPNETVIVEFTGEKGKEIKYMTPEPFSTSGFFIPFAPYAPGLTLDCFALNPNR